MEDNPIRSTVGQAMVEYILVLVFVALIGVLAMKNLKSTLVSTVGALGYELSQHLNVGMCKSQCFGAYSNNKK